MPVDTKHPDYVRLAPIWKKMRDVAEGQSAIHKAGESYLPKLTDETPQEYDARLKRSTFFNATWRTIEGLKGMLFRVAPKTKIAAAVEKMLEDVTKSGVDLYNFAQLVAEECLTVGRVGVMVDYPASSVEGMTVADVEALNLRPHMALYKAETIINWATQWITNRTVLSRVVLEELATLPGKDEFDFKTETRYRVLDLAPRKSDKAGEPATLAYRQRVFKKSKGKDEQVGGDIFPLMNGRPLPFIPFQFIGVDDATPAVDMPPLVDLAYVNLSHYLTTSDRKHGAHKTALPQPWANKIPPLVNQDGTPAPQKFYIGGGDLWTFPGDTQVGMLEYTGQGLGTLKEEREHEEQQMAVLGARMLESQKKGVEAAETAGIHRSGEQSALATQAATMSKGLRTVLGWFQQWGGGGDGPVEFEINREFFPKALTPQELAELVKAWQSGALSKEQLFDNLKNGGVISDAVDYETHETQIANAPPALAIGAPGGDPAAA